MPKRARPIRVAVALRADDPAARDVFDGLLEVARARGWTLGDAATMADADALLHDVSVGKAGPPVDGTPRVSFSTGYRSCGDVRPDASLVHQLAADHFAERGFHGFTPDVTNPDVLTTPAACFLADDAAAAGAVRSAIAAGRRVPDGVAVLGVGNDVPTCERCDVPLSSVDVGPRRIGRRAAERLGRVLGGRPVPAVEDVPPAGVVARASTDTLAVADADVAAAVRFMREHAAGPLRVGDVLRAVDLDRRTLERRFRRALGRSPADYLRRRRVARAAALLRSTTRPMTDIAHATGFRLPQHLAAAFRAVVGQTPSDYRASFRAGERFDALGF